MSAADSPAPRRRAGCGRRRSIPGVIAMGVAIVIAGLGAWQILAVAQARSLARAAPEAALAWRPDDPRALAYRAEQEFQDAAVSGRSPAAARAFARQALRAGPLDVRALRVLAWVAEEEGDTRRARRLMSLAASRSQRDISSHLWMFHDRLTARDFPAAFAHGDALMRHPSTVGEASILIASAAGSEIEAARALEGRLLSGPVWRAGFVHELVASQDPDVALSILLAVKEAGSAIRAEESAAIALRMLKAGRAREAYLAWVLLLPPAGYDFLGYVYNGGFDGPPGAGPFAWALDRKATLVIPHPAARGKALQVWAEAGQEQSLARQTLMLAPGSYRLSLNGRVEGSADDAAMWKILCAGGPVRVLTQLDATISAELHPLTKVFTVPEGCEAQSIELRATGKGTATGWFDDVRIDAVGAEG